MSFIDVWLESQVLTFNCNSCMSINTQSKTIGESSAFFLASAESRWGKLHMKHSQGAPALQQQRTGSPRAADDLYSSEDILEIPLALIMQLRWIINTAAEVTGATEDLQVASASGVIHSFFSLFPVFWWLCLWPLVSFVKNVLLSRCKLQFDVTCVACRL